MAIKRFTSLVEGMFPDKPHLELDGQNIALAGNGAGKWLSTADVDVQGTLDILLVVKGAPGTGWKITLSCAETGEEFFTKSGTTKANGSFTLFDNVASGCPEVDQNGDA